MAEQANSWESGDQLEPRASLGARITKGVAGTAAFLALGVVGAGGVDYWQDSPGGQETGAPEVAGQSITTDDSTDTLSQPLVIGETPEPTRDTIRILPDSVPEAALTDSQSMRDEIIEGTNATIVASIAANGEEGPSIGEALAAISGIVIGEGLQTEEAHENAVNGVVSGAAAGVAGAQSGVNMGSLESSGDIANGIAAASASAAVNQAAEQSPGGIAGNAAAAALGVELGQNMQDSGADEDLLIGVNQAAANAAGVGLGNLFQPGE